MVELLQDTTLGHGDKSPASPLRYFGIGDRVSFSQGKLNKKSFLHFVCEELNSPETNDKCVLSFCATSKSLKNESLVHQATIFCAIKLYYSYKLK